MTREKVIEILQRKTTVPEEGESFDDICEALDIAIKALEQERCDDAISRQAVLDYIHRILNQGTGKKKSFEFIQKYVEQLPPVNPRKTGHWIKIKPYPLQMHDYECSECGHETDDNTENYCSDCGAKMVEPQESEG